MAAYRGPSASSFPGFDRELERWVVEHRAGWLDPIFVALTHVGSFGFVWLVLAAVAALAWRRPAVLAFVVTADVVAELSAGALKAVFGRDRPPLRYPDPEPLVATPASASFPSGHAATSFACAAMLASVTPLPAVPLLGVAAAIAWSRVYVGVHYPLDVVAGALLGLLAAGAVRLAVAGLVRALRTREAAPRRSP